MSRVVLLRHGITDWNESGLIQGRTDRPLSPAGEAQIAAWKPSPDLLGARWHSSPLMRARQTAALLGRAEAEIEPGLAEMAWGAWEGCRLDRLRREHGPAFADREALGLDFRPPGGETPREVAARLRAVLIGLADSDGAARDHVLVTHKGVIRAALHLATGWPLLGPPPLRPGRDDAVAFRLAPDGAIGRPGLLPMLPDSRPVAQG